MGLQAGTRLGPYEIVAPLGAGGMGEVYCARDTRLNRIVAINFLPAHLSSDSTVRERFEREARIISQLNHPHICTLHDVGRHEQVDYLVMELLEGETLADRLEAGALPLDVLLELAVHIADALDAAHGTHVIHRDLKPQNVFVTRRGQAKVLDFGVAKLSDAEAADDDRAAQATALAAAVLTGAGTAIGTVAYMSPEQARGEHLDATSDIFSFGAVLYEMATGRPAFSGKTSAVIIDALLNKTPEPVRTSNAEVPLELERIVGRALAKDRRERYQHASELRADLERLRLDRVSGTAGARGSAPWMRWRTSVALAVGVIALVAVGLALTRSPTTLPASGPIDSIAVLPFVNASGTADADYLSDGLAETLTNNLTRVRRWQLERDPSRRCAARSRARLLAGQTDLAIALSQKMVDSKDPLGPTFLAASFARAGRRNDALAILRKLESEARRSDQGAFLVAAVYAALGDRDPAFRWLEEAYKERDTFLPWLKVDPEFDSLRSDPRFADLIGRIGIPD
ncbi:MAG: protein kinase domain-containing protein [Vicinamibacterales bacterium]